MRKGNKKKKWERPKLIVLARGNPEENVLAGCKNSGGASGPSQYQSRCSKQATVSIGAKCMMCIINAIS